MKTLGDKPNYTCFTCRFCGPETFMLNEQECVECRRDHPNSTFPIMNIESWCWDGKISDSKINDLINR